MFSLVFQNKHMEDTPVLETGVQRLHVVPGGIYAFTLALNKHPKTNIALVFQFLGYPVSKMSGTCLCLVETDGIYDIFHLLYRSCT